MECVFCEEHIGDVEFPICGDCHTQIILDALMGGNLNRIEKKKKKKTKHKNQEVL